MMVEGSKVSFVGHPNEHHDIGDMGLVVQADGSASHIRWLSGASEGKITFQHDDDLVVVTEYQPRPNFWEDDLSTGRLVTVAVRNVYESLGQAGLLNALNDEGHLSVFQPIAEEAIAMVASRIRQDPSFIEVLSELEEDEGDAFVIFATFSLLKDAFGDDEEQDV